MNRENQRTRGLHLRGRLGTDGSYAKGSTDPLFKDLIGAMDPSLRNIHIPLCMLHPQRFYTHIGGLKGLPYNLSTELVTIDPVWTPTSYKEHT